MPPLYINISMYAFSAFLLKKETLQEIQQFSKRGAKRPDLAAEEAVAEVCYLFSHNYWLVIFCLHVL